MSIIINTIMSLCVCSCVLSAFILWQYQRSTVAGRVRWQRLALGNLVFTCFALAFLVITPWILTFWKDTP